RIFGAITRTTAATTKLAHIQMYGDHNTLNVKTISFYSLLYNFTTRTTHTHTHTHILPSQCLRTLACCKLLLITTHSLTHSLTSLQLIKIKFSLIDFIGMTI